MTSRLEAFSVVDVETLVTLSLVMWVVPPAPI